MKFTLSLKIHDNFKMISSIKTIVTKILKKIHPLNVPQVGNWLKKDDLYNVLVP